jgi:Concanavalin A-like lectin/glucanases superfamily/FlgD Ig-like domain
LRLKSGSAGQFQEAAVKCPSIISTLQAGCPRGVLAAIATLGALVVALLWPALTLAQSGPIARWNFDASSGADSSGNHFDMTPGGGVVFASGRGGKIAVLNGTSAFLQAAPNVSFTPHARSWSISAWVEATTPATGVDDYFFEWYRCGANPSCGGGDAATYSFDVDANGSADFYYRDDGAHVLQLRSSASIIDNKFHFIVGTFDSVTKRGALYLDGALAASDSVPAMGALSDGGVQIPVQLGRNFVVGWDVPNRYFQGSLDDARIYSRTLSPAEVSALFNGTTLGVSPAPAPSPSVDLAPVLPNPSRGPTHVAFTLAQPSLVHLRVYDVLGREVRELIDGSQGAGAHQVTWDGTDNAGARVGGGVYFYRLESRPLDGGAAIAQSVRGTLLR